jgi:hypothetical protein
MNSQPGKSAKKVIFHIGFPKTGSSALQAFLSANAASLKEGGVFYPYPEPDSVVATGACTGNLVQIMYRDGFVDRHQRRSGRPTKIREVLDESFLARVVEITENSNSDCILFSSEALGTSSLTSLQYLKDRLSGNHDLKLIGFVRDTFDSFYSAWRQQLKGQKTTVPFSEYVRNRIESRQPAPAVSDFVKLQSIGLEPVLINYDTYRADIVRTFFNVAEIPLPQSPAYQLSGDRYNASLTAAEAALVQMVSTRFPNGDFLATLSKLLLRRPAEERGGGNFYSAEIDGAILSAFAPVIEDMNKSIAGEQLRTTVRSWQDSFPGPGSGEIDCLLEAVDIALRAADKRKNRSSVIDWVRRLLKLSKLPQGFSPEAYLFHNQDVAGAGIDPGLHYLSHGRVEERRYRFS